MEPKTKIHAEDGKQDLLITRVFDLQIDLLFKAYTEAGLVAQWMGTNVLKLDCSNHGSYLFETIDPKGNKHRFNGTIHSCLSNQRIVRTFEMENTPFPVQLEFLEFTAVDEKTSQLTMQIIYRSAEDRDRMLQLPFAQGINMAHNRIQELFTKIS